MPNLIIAARDFYNSERGRKIVNWGVTAFGALTSAGLIPIDMPIPYLGLSLGTLITLLGLRLPSTPPVKPGALRL